MKKRSKKASAEDQLDRLQLAMIREALRLDRKRNRRTRSWEV
jgi:hypothetical protein